MTQKIARVLLRGGSQNLVQGFTADGGNQSGAVKALGQNNSKERPASDSALRGYLYPACANSGQIMRLGLELCVINLQQQLRQWKLFWKSTLLRMASSTPYHRTPFIHERATNGENNGDSPLFSPFGSGNGENNGESPFASPFSAGRIAPAGARATSRHRHAVPLYLAHDVFDLLTIKVRELASTWGRCRHIRRVSIG